MNGLVELSRTAAAVLKDADVEDYAFEGNVLAKHCIENNCQGDLPQLCKRRAGGEPLQYIIGEWDFYDLTFKVGEGVLIPRQGTETLVDTALGKLPQDKPLTVIDLCAGSGCIGMSLEKHLENLDRLFCVELSDKALGYLEENKRLNGSSAVTVKGDVRNELTAQKLPSADLIVCNPPYLTAEDMKDLQREVAFEPKEALFGGEDGLDLYRDIVRIWKNDLVSGGMMMFECGAGQHREVMDIMIRHGFADVRAVKDLGGIFRAVYGYKRGGGQ